MLAVALIASLFVAACGGGSPEPADSQTAQPNTGTVALLFTDMPTDMFSSIVLTVSEATLIGSDDSHHVLFSSAPGEERHIDLLDLTNYNEPVMFGEVMAGTYKKIRLQLDSIELVPNDGSPAFFVEKLPANGKVDLLQPDGFDVLPGRTVMIEIDVDANKSIHIVQAGNSGKVNFRPVVRVNIFDAGMPHKLARLEGAVSGDPDMAAGTFALCSIDAPDHCVDVATSGMTSFFDDAGLYTNFGSLADGDMVVVIGEYGSDPIVLNALVVENGGNAEQITGTVASNPAESQFLVLTIDGLDYIVELQSGTKFYDASGPITGDLIALGDRVEVEGVIPAKADPEDPDMIRAALVFLEANEAEQLSGTIAAGTLDADTRSFELTTDGGPVCVRVAEMASVLLVNTTDAIVTAGAFADLADDQVVDLFGATAEDACFDADEVIVDVTPPPSE
jgi:hypothetical protein